MADAQDELDAAVDEVLAWAESSGTDVEAPGGQPATTPSATPSPGEDQGGATAGQGGTSTGPVDGVTGQAGASTTQTQGGSTPSDPGSGSLGQGSRTVAQAQAAVDQAELDVTAAELALTRATLVAPADGVLTAFPFSEGEEASTSDIATVTTEGAVAVPIEVGEEDISAVQVGQEAVLGSATGGTSEGSVSAVAILPTGDASGAATWTVTLLVTQPDAGLAVGTTATATVTIGSAADAALVPISALTLTGADTGTVRVLDGGEAVTRTVQLGVRGTTHVEVADGLAVGEAVVLSDPDAAIPSTGSGITRGREPRRGHRRRRVRPWLRRDAAPVSRSSTGGSRR